MNERSDHVQKELLGKWHIPSISLLITWKLVTVQQQMNRVNLKLVPMSPQFRTRDIKDGTPDSSVPYEVDLTAHFNGVIYRSAKPVQKWSRNNRNETLQLLWRLDVRSGK